MLKRYPYWGWLILSVLLWCAAGYHYYEHRQALLPERMAHVVTEDLQRSELSLKYLTYNRLWLVKKLYTDSLKDDDIRYVKKLPFRIFCYDKGQLIFWNTNDIIAGNNINERDSTRLLYSPRGVFLQQAIVLPALGPQRKLVVLTPIVTYYPVENDYLRSHFAAADYIPISTEVLPKPVKGSIAINNLSGRPAFYMRFHPQDIQPWVPHAQLIGLLILALLTSISYIQLMTIHLTRKRSPLIGFLVTVGIIAIFRTLTYIYGLPFNLESLPFFSPQLYASSIWLSSLGNLLINILCCLWIVVFITRHTPYRTFFDKVKAQWLRYAIALVLIALLVSYPYAFVFIIKNLVIDSSISFDVSHFYAIDWYTIVGLFIIGIITGVSCLIIYLFNVQITNLVAKKWIKYVLVAITGIIIIATTQKADPVFSYLLLGWLLLFIVLLDIRNFTLVSDLFAPHMVFWALFICAFSTAILQYFNHIKEQETRKVFVDQRIAHQRDELMEYTFDNIVKNIEQDKIIKSFFSKPVPANRKQINERFDALYTGKQLNKYQAKVYLFDDKGASLYNKDTVDYNTLVNEIDESTPTNSTALFYKEYVTNGQSYVAYIPVENDTTGKTAGYVFISLDLKRAANETVYPELLQPASIKANPNEKEYAYAIYINNRLITQTNDYPFPVTLKNDTLRTGGYAFYNRINSSELWYRYNDKRTVIVVHYHDLGLEMITLFSYMFGIQVLLALLIVMYQLYISYFINPDFPGRFTRLTLRRRVHFSMLSVVLLSFMIIGFATIYFFTTEYRKSNKDKLQAAMQVVEQSVEQYLAQVHAFSDEGAFDTVSHSASFKYFITNLASVQHIDINIFDDKGGLNVTSQDDIYDKGLLSRIMRPDAYYQLVTQGKSTLIQDEKIGKLSYLSSYVPLRNERGISLGYVNVPFFSSENDLNFQISNIVVTLMNVYAFIFLVSSLLTVVMTRWLTRTLNVIISQFGRLNLQRNERIDWPYDDEIGLLVSEYNKMVKKVEENAILLAQSERESAWREMARQVAHEIKNPLTPMKLNIQHLQQALRSDHANIKELADRVSNSLIEQIDNLSYIASEFSNFAKMPEAKPEVISLGAILNNAAELYLNAPDITMHLEQPSEKIFVFADRSQLLRVFTNLFENAKQAIPENRKGNIEVTLKNEDGTALIAIKDNGAGIPENTISRIFQPYFTTKSSGTGLGLAMTKKIIEFWKGEIWFETTEGKGSTFFIRMPLMGKER